MLTLLYNSNQQFLKKKKKSVKQMNIGSLNKKKNSFSNEWIKRLGEDNHMHVL